MRLGQLGRREEELAAYDLVEDRYRGVPFNTPRRCASRSPRLSATRG